MRVGLQPPSFLQVKDTRRQGAGEDAAIPSGDTGNEEMGGPTEPTMENKLTRRVWVGLEGRRNTASP